MPLQSGSRSECLGEPGRSVRELRPSTTAAHDVETVDRFRRPQEDTSREPLRPRHHVQEPVDAVVEVDVRGARGTEQGRVTCRATDSGGRVARLILGPRVGFRLDDPGDGPLARAVGAQRAAEQRAGHVNCGPAEKLGPDRAGTNARVNTNARAGTNTRAGTNARADGLGQLSRSARLASSTTLARPADSTSVSRAGSESMISKTRSPKCSKSTSAVRFPTPA